MQHVKTESLANRENVLALNGWDFLDRNRDWLTACLAVIISLIVMLFFHKSFDDLDEVRDLAVLISVLGGSIGGVRALERAKRTGRSDPGGHS